MSPRQPNLERSIRDLRDEICNLLNATVTTGVRLGSVTRYAHQWERVTGYIGYHVTGGLLEPDDLLPAGHAFLAVSYTLDLDDEGYALVRKSRFAIYGQADDAQPFVRFEYERDAEKYPVAHIQVHGESEALGKLNEKSGQSKALSKLHLPVGGKRYRPTLEDVIQFLIEEGYAEERMGYQEAIKETLEPYFARQLGAAVRRDPVTAWDALQRTEWWSENNPYGA